MSGKKKKSTFDDEFADAFGDSAPSGGPSFDDEFGAAFGNADAPQLTADMPDRQPSQPLVAGPGLSPVVAPKPLTEDAKNPNDPPTGDGWLDALVSAGRTAKDTYLGATNGATMDLADDLVPQGMGNEMRVNSVAAEARSPMGYGIGHAVGGFVPSLAMGAACLLYTSPSPRD
jgi:hypothetical protein